MFAHGDHELAPPDVRKEVKRRQNEAQSMVKSLKAFQEPTEDEPWVSQREGPEVYFKSDDEGESAVGTSADAGVSVVEHVPGRARSPTPAGRRGSRSRSRSGGRGRSRSRSQSRSRSRSCSRNRSRSFSRSRSKSGSRSKRRGGSRSRSRSRSRRRNSRSRSRSKSRSRSPPQRQPQVAAVDETASHLTHRLDGLPLNFSSRDEKQVKQKMEREEEIYEAQQAEWGLGAGQGVPTSTTTAHLLTGLSRTPRGRGRGATRPYWQTRQEKGESIDQSEWEEVIRPALLHATLRPPRCAAPHSATNHRTDQPRP